MGDPLVDVRGLTFSYDDQPVLHDIDFQAHEGEVVALIGRNGSGKTTLLKHLNGLLRPVHGEVLIENQPIAGKPVWAIARTVGYVPQHPGSILHQETLAEELRFTLNAQDQPGDIGETLSTFGIERYAMQNPLDLSGGERQRAAIAAFAVAQPRVLILDEPTRGLPAAEKARLARFARDYASRGNCVILATHDPEFVASCADRVVQLESGRVVANGAPAEVLAGSPVYATQINRIFGGLTLTIDDVIAASGVLR